MHLLRLIFLATFSFPVWSDDFAKCSMANQQLKLLNDFMSSEQRVLASQVLIKEIELLRPHMEKNKTGLPNKLIQLCFDIKRKAFQATYMKGGASLFGNYEFLMAAGKYFYFERVWSLSLESFENAVKLRPNYFAPNYLAMQAQIYAQLTAEKPMPANAYQRKLKGFVDNLLKAKDITAAETKMIVSFLAEAEQKNSKIYTARALLEKSVTINPDDMKIRAQLGQLEESAGRFDKAKKVYEDALVLKLRNPVVEKQILVRLTRLYTLLGEQKSRDAILKHAINSFPKDPYFLQLAKERNLAAVKKQSAN